MTFLAATRTLPIVVYGQLRTLVSLLIVFVLAAMFLWGGSRLLASVIGAAPPLPTPTVPSVIEQPPASSTTRSTTHRNQARQSPTPTPATPTPAPTSAPKGPPKVFMTSTLAAAPTPVSAFPLGLDRIYCWVRNGVLPPGTASVTFYWTRDEPNGFITQFALAPSSGSPFTIAYPPTSINQTTGKYRCDVIINQQIIGSAHFHIGP